MNCAALPESIAESELFGHVKGAYTGADATRVGKFELAEGGTLFLDEIGELPLSVQPKLLRAIQSGEIQRLGSDRNAEVDVRIIAATNRDLKTEVAAGRLWKRRAGRGGGASPGYSGRVGQGRGDDVDPRGEWIDAERFHPGIEDFGDSFERTMNIQRERLTSPS